MRSGLHTCLFLLERQERVRDGLELGVKTVKDEGSKAREKVELAKHLSCKYRTRVFNSESTLIKNKGQRRADGLVGKGACCKSMRAEVQIPCSVYPKH